MKQAIVLDWDGVVFDDDAYKVAFVSALSAYLPVEQIERLYDDSKDGNGYNDHRLASAVAANVDMPVQRIQNVLDDVMARTTDSFIFEDARRLITSDRSDIPLIILTAGNERIQSAKITASKLGSQFDQVVIVPADKTEHAKETALSNLLAEHYKIVFFDDRLSTIKHVKSIFDQNQVTGIYVDRLGSSDEPFSVRQLPLAWSEVLSLDVY